MSHGSHRKWLAAAAAVAVATGLVATASLWLPAETAPPTSAAPGSLIIRSSAEVSDSSTTSTTPPPSTTAVTSTTTTTTIPPTTTSRPVSPFAAFPFHVGVPSHWPPPAEQQTAPANYAGFPANGTGCVIGSADELPDGVYFGYVASASGGGTRMQFDMACLYEGAAAKAEATFSNAGLMDGGLFVRNARVRFVTAFAYRDAVAYALSRSGEFEPMAINVWAASSSEAGRYQRCPGNGCAVWVYVNDGLVTELVEQFFG